LSYVPEDRLGQGAVPGLDMTDNGILTGHGTGSVKAGWIRKNVARAFAASCIAEFDVRNGRPNGAASTLSGGNLQKFILGRELLQNPKLLLIGQPTWGLDVGSATFVRRQIISAARDKGAAVLVVSEELEELFEICDRIAVMVKGRLSPPLPVDRIDTETIGLLMGGMDGSRTSMAVQSKDASHAH
jgi:simple sugar transport system ATP-binding protein